MNETSIASIGAIIRDAASTVHGGAELERWVRQLLGYFCAEIEIVALASVVVPQVGSDAGIERSFVAKRAEDEVLVATLAHIASDFWDRGGVDPQTVSIPISGVTAVIVPIASGFDRAVGYFLAAVRPEHTANALSALGDAAALVSIVVRAEIATDALDYLARPTWITSATTERTAAEVADVCLKAMSAAAVIVWEVQDNPAMLKTLAVASSQSAPVSLDMHLGQGIAGRCALDSRTILVDDLADVTATPPQSPLGPLSHPDIVTRMGWRAAMYIPLDVGGHAAGVLAAYSRRPRAFNQIDLRIGEAFAHRLAAGYVHVERLEQLSEMERRIALEAPAIEAGIRAMERVHDADNCLLFAQSQLSNITSRFRSQQNHPINEFAIAAANHVDGAHKVIRSLVRRAKISAPILTPRVLHDILSEVVEEVTVQAETIGASIHFSCPRDLRVRADKEQLPRVFLNLLSNAIHFLETDNKAGTKRIRVEASQKSEDRVAVVVADNGPGIDPTAIPKVFDYFYTTRGSRGMGFGLAIAKGIVTAHGGTISVKSRWGYETVFTVDLPLLRDQ